ncbi:MAG TPA: hypothetical protein VHH55_09535 [Gaiellaceae bacterium]|jgi:hypothetical protein|nr:hypothetical protein [Gaiellaceae bacterium]
MPTKKQMQQSDTEEREEMSASTMQAKLLDVTSPQFRLGAVVAVALLAFLTGWIVMNRDDAPTSAAPGAATAASEDELRSVAKSSPHPVYWAGPKEGHTYELTKTSDGRVYVRYLPEGTEVGDPRGRFLTIGTYPRQRAFAELQRAARAEGAVSLKVGRDGLAVFSEARPTSVYLGYPKASYQVEVFHPSPDEARRLALAGQVVPVR